MPTSEPVDSLGSSAMFDPGAEPITHPLIGIARDLQARMVTGLRDDHGYPGLRPSLGPFLSLVWLEPRPLTLLAQRLSITKQGASQLARLAEASGYLERASEGDDGRVRLVGLSARGCRLVADAIRIMRKSESEYAEQVGPERFRRFARACAALYGALQVQPELAGGGPDPARPALGGLPQMALEIQRRLIAATSALGHRGLRLSHAQVLPHVGPGGTRVRDLALRHRVSRQAVSLTCRELEALGYLKRKADLDDRRGAILRLTRHGERLLADSIEASHAMEREFAVMLGEDRFLELRETAHALFDWMRERAGDAVVEGVPAPRLRLLAARKDERVGVRSGLAGPKDSVRATRSRDRSLDLLALRLRARLGARDAARLAALLLAERETDRAGKPFRQPKRSK